LKKANRPENGQMELIQKVLAKKGSKRRLESGGTGEIEFSDGIYDNHTASIHSIEE
jgi:hypothetical protein